jgi:hypothetical protein
LPPSLRWSCSAWPALSSWTESGGPSLRASARAASWRPLHRATARPRRRRDRARLFESLRCVT